MVLTLAVSLFVVVPLGLLIVSIARTIASGPSDQLAPAPSFSGRSVTPIVPARSTVAAPEAAPVASSAPSPVPAGLLAAARAVNAGPSRFVTSADVIAFPGRPSAPVDEPRSITG